MSDYDLVFVIFKISIAIVYLCVFSFRILYPKRHTITESKKVQVTFCDMRPNIFDLKKKRRQNSNVKKNKTKKTFKC